MSKPDDIPQDVWDVALRVWAELLTADHVGDPEVALRDVDEIARAILAAKAEEREACALLAAHDGGMAVGGAGNMDFGPNVASRIAAAIYKRGAP